MRVAVAGASPQELLGRIGPLRRGLENHHMIFVQGIHHIAPARSGHRTGRQPSVPAKHLYDLIRVGQRACVRVSPPTGEVVIHPVDGLLKVGGGQGRPVHGRRTSHRNDGRTAARGRSPGRGRQKLRHPRDDSSLGPVHAGRAASSSCRPGHRADLDRRLIGSLQRLRRGIDHDVAGNGRIAGRPVIARDRNIARWSRV